LKEQLEIKPQIAVDENTAPQYHNPNDLSTIEKQLGIIQSAEDTFKKIQEELDEKKNEIEEKDSLIKQANELIQQLREKVDEKEKTKEEVLLEVESSKSSEIIQRAIEFANSEKARSKEQAEKEAESIIQNAQTEADKILAEAEKEAKIAEQRKDDANSLYLEIVEKLKNFGVQIDNIISDSKSVKVNKPETKKEVKNDTSDVKEVKEPKPAIKKENKPEDKTEKTDQMTGWSQFGVQEENKPKGKTSRTKTKEEIELAEMLNAK
jgi:hypothetical protein